MSRTMSHSILLFTLSCVSPAIKMQEERTLHEAKLAKMEAEMNLVFQQKVAEKEAKLKQSEEELYARHREMKEALDDQVAFEAFKAKIRQEAKEATDGLLGRMTKASA